MIPKYRAWDKTHKKLGLIDADMVDGLFQSVKIFDEDGDDWQESENFILMQSTGLKDKNDVEIFEGDVVRFSHLSGHLFNGFINRVAWDKHNAAFKLVPLDMTWSDTYFSNFEGDTLKSLEVVGNVYEKDKLEEAINDTK